MSLYHSIVNWLTGKKSYIVAGLILVLSVLSGFDICTIPEWMWGCLAALGLGTVRIAVSGIQNAMEA